MGNAQMKITYPPSFDVSETLEHGKIEWRDNELGQLHISKRDGAVYGCGGKITFRSSQRESGQFLLLIQTLSSKMC